MILYQIKKLGIVFLLQRKNTFSDTILVKVKIALIERTEHLI